MPLLIHTECFNPFMTNCHFLTDSLSDCTVIIDPACYYRRERTRITRLASLNKWKVCHVVATHMHVDHVFGAAFVSETFGCRLEASPADDFWVGIAGDRCRQLGIELRSPIPHAAAELHDGDTVCFGGERLRVIAVPGHSPGSIAFYHEESGSLFSGDTLFRGDIGRTDLPGGDRDALLESISERLFALPDDTSVYPGHSLPTTIGEEKRRFALY